MRLLASTLGAAILWKNSQLESISIEARDLNKPIGATGAFLQNLKGSYSTINFVYNSKTYKDAFYGSAKITAGPKISLNLPDFLGGPINESLVNLDLEALITQDLLNAKGSVRVLGNLITGQGEVNLNWKVNSFLATANLNILYGLIIADATLIARGREDKGTKLDFFAYATGSVNIPTPIPVIGGFTLGSGGVYFQYIDDGQSYNDYVAAWGQLLGWTVGLKIGFDGSVGLIGSELPALAKTHIENLKRDINNPYLMAPLSLPSKGSNNNDLIDGNDQSELLEGAGGNDIIHGKGGDDILEGGDGNDILNGGAGKNAYTGGAGNDILIGGTGDDIYNFDADSAQGSDTVNESIIAIKFARDTFWWNGGWKVGYAQATKTFWNIQQQDSNDGITDETKFTVINNGDGTVSLKTIYDRFWSADKVSNITSSENLQSWEKFTIINNNDGTTSLKSVHNTYVRANTTTATDARWNIDQSNELNAWEKFTVEDQNNNSKDTLDFSATTTKRINIDLGRTDKQIINENLSLTLGIAVGSQTFINIENAIGGSQADSLSGNHLDNRLQGNGGDDTIDGGDGSDSAVYSGKFEHYTVVREGSDFLVYDNRSGAPDGVDRVRNVERLIFSGDVQFQPNAANTGTIQNGTAGGDMLIGSAFGDQLSGGDGKDTLIGGAGNDILRGGNDLDIVDYSRAPRGVDVSLGYGITINNDGFGNRDVLWEIENLSGSQYNDTLSGESYAFNNVIYGRGGDDKIFGQGGDDTLYGDHGIGSPATVEGQFVKVATWDAANLDAYQDIRIAGRFLGKDYDSILSQSTTGFLIGTPANKSQITINDPEFDRRQVKVMAGDFDGDGWDDLFRLEYADWCDSYRDAEIYLNRPNGAGGRSFVKSIDLSSALSIRGDLTNIIIGDFNGDKKSDFLRQEKGWWDDDNTYTIIAFLNTSTTSAATTNLSFNSFDQKLEELKGDISKLVVGDFNGDGKDDFIRQGIGSNSNDNALIYLSSWYGNKISFDSQLYGGRIQEGLNGDLTDIIVGDFNGDNKDDFIRQEKGWWAAVDDIRTAELFINKTNMTWDINWKFGATDMVIPVSEKLSVENGRFITGNFHGNNKTDLFLNGFSNNAQSARSDLVLTTDIPAGNDTLNGGEGNDWLYGGAGEDELHGDNGNDRLYGGAGKDKLWGGDGSDVADYSDAPRGVNVTLGWGATIIDDGHGNQDVLWGIENLSGSNFADILSGESYSFDNIINGLGGNDTIYGKDGNDTLNGGEGNDWLSGGEGNDWLYGGAGEDELHGDNGNDRLYGGAGKDKLWGGDGSDVNVTLGWGATIIDDGHGNQDVLWGIENLSGSNFADILSGESYSFDNIINGLGGNDTIYGKDGNDTLNGGDGVDIVYGGNGNDALNGDNGNDQLIGGDGDDNLFGGAGDDWIIGGLGLYNTIDGGDGFDRAEFQPILNSRTGKLDRNNLTITRINAVGSTRVTGFRVQDFTTNSASTVGLSVEEIGYWASGSFIRYNTTSLLQFFNTNVSQQTVFLA
jgi:Ca2+-binding RTX toxin-like protein